MMSYDKYVGKRALWIMIAAIGFVAVTITSIFPPLAALIVLVGLKLKQEVFHDQKN
jgi:hypothetical protein